MTSPPNSLSVWVGFNVSTIICIQESVLAENCRNMFFLIQSGYLFLLTEGNWRALDSAKRWYCRSSEVKAGGISQANWTGERLCCTKFQYLLLSHECWLSMLCLYLIGHSEAIAFQEGWVVRFLLCFWHQELSKFYFPHCSCHSIHPCFFPQCVCYSWIFHFAPRLSTIFLLRHNLFSFKIKLFNFVLSFLLSKNDHRN